LAGHLTDAAIGIERDDEFPGYDRFYTADPVRNRLEFMEPTVR
jgi:hypothetical protein